MEKCFDCGREGEIGKDIILHTDPARGEIKLCHKCHKRRHRSLNPLK